MTSASQWVCPVCTHNGLQDGGDGFYYCARCNSQADDIIETGVDEDDLFGNNDGGMYSASNRRHGPSQVFACEPISQVKLTQSEHWDSLENFGSINLDDPRDMEGPIGPSDFGSHRKKLKYEDYYSEIRLRYVMGIQIMIQLQCKALVEKFNLNPLIVGVVGPIWLRFLASTGISTDEWANDVISKSESLITGKTDKVRRKRYENEYYNIHGKRMVTLWHRSLSSKIPLYYSLAINFLVCHLAREPLLPTDIFQWTLEGKLPYFAAFVEIEKQLGPPSLACPIKSVQMFRPHSLISAQKLESLAAVIALDIGLDLPPVNFYSIASLFLNKLSIPVKRILPHALRVYEWSMPPELYISTNVIRLPTRAFVMSILIVTIRIIFNLNGGIWEKSLSSSRCSSSPADENGEHLDFNSIMDDADDESSCENEHRGKPLDGQDLDFKFDAVDLLTFLEQKYSELGDTYDYSKDLFSYLQYCKQVVFAESETPFEDFGEENIIKDLWDSYLNQTSVEEAMDKGISSSSRSGESPKISDRNRVIDNYSQQENHLRKCRLSQKTKSKSSSGKDVEEEAIKLLKLDMEENRFCYIPISKRTRKSEYTYYPRKRKEGMFLYAVHADYYILLRSCAKVAKVDLRTLHIAVLTFESRLKQLEDRIDYCLNVTDPNFNSDEINLDNDDDDGMNFL